MPGGDSRSRFPRIMSLALLLMPLLPWFVHMRASQSVLNWNLIGAAMSHDPPGVRRYLSEGADIDGTMPRMNGRTGFLAAGRQVLRIGPGQGGPGFTALMGAALTRDLPTMRILLKAGANPLAVDELGYTPLLYAARKRKSGSGPAIRLLLAHGADLRPKAKDGATVWTLAAHHPDGLKALNEAVRRSAPPK